MIVRIGIADSIRELRLELDDDATVDQVRAALAADHGTVWLQDRHGNEFAVRTEFVTWVEVDPSASLSVRVR